MNPLDLKKNDLLMLPKKGAVPSRRVLVVGCEIATDPWNDEPLCDPSTGEILYDVTYLSEDSRVEEITLKAKQVTLISRNDSGSH